MRRQVAHHFKTIPETLYFAYDVLDETGKDRLNLFQAGLEPFNPSDASEVVPIEIRKRIPGVAAWPAY